MAEHLGMSTLTTPEAFEQRYVDLFVQDQLLSLIRTHGWTPRQEFFFSQPDADELHYNLLRQGLQLKKLAIKQALVERFSILQGVYLPKDGAFHAVPLKSWVFKNDDEVFERLPCNCAKVMCVECTISMPNCYPEMVIQWRDGCGYFTESEGVLFSDSWMWTLITQREAQVLQAWTMGLHYKVGAHSSLLRLLRHTLFETQCLRLIVDFL